MDIASVDFTPTGRFEIVSSSNLDVVAPLRTNLGYAMSALEAYGLMRSGGTLMDQTTGFRTEINTTGLATERFDLERDLQEIAKVPQLTLGGLRTVTEASERFPRARGSLDPRRRGSRPRARRRFRSHAVSVGNVVSGRAARSGVDGGDGFRHRRGDAGRSSGSRPARLASRPGRVAALRSVPRPGPMPGLGAGDFGGIFEFLVRSGQYSERLQTYCDVGARGRGLHFLVDIEDFAVRPHVIRPAERKLTLRGDDPVGFRDPLFGIAQDRIVD